MTYGQWLAKTIFLFGFFCNECEKFYDVLNETQGLKMLFLRTGEYSGTYNYIFLILADKANHIFSCSRDLRYIKIKANLTSPALARLQRGL